MGRKALEYGAWLIGLYLVVAHGSEFGKAMSATANGGVAGVKALQGR